MRIIEDYCQRPNGSWANRSYDMDLPVDMIKYVARIRFTFPGGYELAIVTDDGGLICQACVRDNYGLMLRSTKGDYHDGWQAAGVTYDGELENDNCSHCSKPMGYQNDESPEARQ